MSSRYWLLLLATSCSEYDFHGKADVEPPGEPESSPAIVVTPSAVDLGTVAPGQTGDEVVTIENVGDADLVLSDLSVALATSWSITAGGLATLTPGSTEDIVLTWTSSEDTAGADTLSIASNDPTTPVVEVPLSWSLEVDTAPPGVIQISPPSWDFGVVEVGQVETTQFTVENIGDGPLTVTDVGFSATSTELDRMPLRVGLPWMLGPGASETIEVAYTPTDEEADEGAVLAMSDHGDAQADVFGVGKTFEGFSTGWYIWDPRVPVPTTGNADYVVDHHGDPDSYFYEPSGAHGMSDSTAMASDFAILRNYVIANAGAPIIPTGPFDWDESSTVSQFNEATFTYFLCDFYLPPDADPTTYTIESGRVDDGIRVIVNGHILGHLLLGEAGGSWTLEHAVPGAVNTLVVILVDDAAVHKYLSGLGFWHDGALVEG